LGVAANMEESLFPKFFDSGRELLKWIAIATMTVDHVGAVLFPDFEVLRFIGRFSFPLFAYLLVLGAENTSNIRNYFLRLFIFALVSQVPFFLAIGNEPFELLNIFFTLSTGLVFLHFFRKNSVFAIVPIFVSLFLPFDYGVYGIAVIGCMYLLRANTKLGAAALVIMNSLFLFPWNTQFLSVAAIPLVVLHNRGSLNLTEGTPAKLSIPLWRKYFFYVYYPLHLALLYIIKLYLF
jgi:hypothetical protein